MPILEHDSDTIWFDHLGSGTPLFLVAGLSGSARFWEPQLSALARKHLIITHDHRGTDRSGRRRMDYSVEQMANDVLALADHLGIQHFHFAGHSTGGAIGQHLAVHHPERIRSLVLSSTWPGPDSYFQSLFTLRRDVLRDMGMSAYKRIANLMLKPPAMFKAEDDVMTATGTTEESKDTDLHITISRIQALLAFDMRDSLASIHHPTLVICARDDAVTPFHCSTELAESIPNAKLHALDTGGHFYPQVDPDLFTQVVSEFLEACDT